MLFNSVVFLIFFSVFYLSYINLARRPQNVLLVIASYIFYGWWDWRFLALLVLTTVIDYTVGLGIENATRPSWRKKLLLVSICANLTILFFFKYFNFFSESAHLLLNRMGIHLPPLALHIILPVGLSFYTFQSMAYIIDIYRGKLKACRDPLDYAVFVSFFPQLVAGPIERGAHMLPQIQRPRVISYQLVREGMWLILLGYFKKVVIADNLAVIASEVFNHPANYHGLATLLGIYAFAIQIYCDFSGYTDIARGIANLMGFNLMLNFKMPYFSTNPKEFWSRWHISLSTWLRDYLYIPLGGSRGGSLFTYRNLAITMLLGGLWHGAAWHFVAWGAFQGAILIIHRLALQYVFKSKGEEDAASGNLLGRLARMLFMFQVICVGWIFFRINSIADFPVIMKNLFTRGPWDPHWLGQILLLSTPLLLIEALKERTGDLMAVKRMPAWSRVLVYGCLFMYILLCGKGDGSEFIYFQF